MHEWQDRGTVLQKGGTGSWDARLTGMINPCTVIRKNGTYFLYYIGASGNRATDGGPAFRALGVATSTDGEKFVKFSGNPVLKHLPHNNPEEGIFSAGSSLDENGNIVLHYGAIWAANETTESVRSYIAAATSRDGFVFEDKGYIVRWDDPDVWGYGDELSPVGSMRSKGNWYVYYIAKGTHVPLWSLGLAWGPAANHLPNTEPVFSKLNFIDGGGDPVLLGDGKLALFVNPRNSRNKIEIRTSSLSAPGRFGSAVQTYYFKQGIFGQTVFLDAESETWRMYYLSGKGNAIRLMTAPVSYTGS